jgi:transcriptional regulator with XRE-family HTH domain
MDLLCMQKTLDVTADPAPAQDDDAAQIGQRLRALRNDRNLTILELAAKAGLSAGIISQIERGNSNPSISTLQKLRGALGVTLWAFLEREPGATEGEPAFVRRRHNRPRFVVGPGLLTKELLSPKDNNQLRFMILNLPPGATSDDVLTGPGDKAGYVLSGRVELTVGNAVTEIGEGDSFQFESSIPHQLVNRSGEETKLIWIIRIREAHL